MDTLLRVPQGATKKKIIKGRGKAARKGGTAGKGNNGQNARAGGGVRTGFEGGQMPLYRRVAIKGFSNARYKVEYQVINVRDLQNRFKKGETVDVASLRDKGLISGSQGVKLLGDGDISVALNVHLSHVSKSAAEKVEKAGGKIVNNEANNG